MSTPPHESGNHILSAAEFGSIFALSRTRFEVIANRYVRNAAIAEDIVSESFMTLWENRSRIIPGENVQAYVLTIVRNKCLNWLSAQKRHLQIEQNVHKLRMDIVAEDIRSLEAFDPREIFSEEISAIIQRTLDQMPELTRRVFVARRFDEKNYKEIAEMYGITLRRVEFELSKAAKMLKIALKDYLPALLLLLSGGGY